MTAKKSETTLASRRDSTYAGWHGVGPQHGGVSAPEELGGGLTAQELFSLQMGGPQFGVSAAPSGLDHHRILHIRRRTGLDIVLFTRHPLYAQDPVEEDSRAVIPREEPGVLPDRLGADGVPEVPLGEPSIPRVYRGSTKDENLRPPGPNPSLTGKAGMPRYAGAAASAEVDRCFRGNRQSMPGPDRA